MADADPTSMTEDHVRAAYDALGLDPDGYQSTTRIDIDPSSVTVTRHRRDGAGRIAFSTFGGVRAEETVRIPTTLTRDYEPEADRG